MKKAMFSNKGRGKILEGINIVARAVGKTLGPKGRNAILSQDVAPPIITNDGVSIASYFNKVKDPFVNTGVQMIKEVANKQNEPGDGTTTAVVLAASMANEGAKHILAGIDPMAIKDGIERAAKKTLKKLKKVAMPVSNEKDLIDVATVSVEDKEAGKLIGEMMHQVGKDGAVTVETSKDTKLEKDMTNGMKFDQGFIHPLFMTNPFRQEAHFAEVPILVTDHEISVNEEISPIADALVGKGIKALIIICADMKGEALNTAIKNKLEGVFNFLVIRLPGFDEERTQNGRDIAIACGARFISKDLDKIEEVQPQDLGTADKTIASREDTVLVRGGGTEKEIKDRVKVLKKELDSAIADFERDKLRERIARITGGVGVLRVGAATEQELGYKKHKIEDSLAATRAAMEEGIVPGGGVALLRIAEDSDNMGEKIFYNAICEPIRKIVRNAGKNPETIIEKVLEHKNPNFGWNAKKDKYQELLIAGITDPVKVTRKAIENAVSMAVMYLTSESLIVDVEKKKPQDQIPGR